MKLALFPLMDSHDFEVFRSKPGVICPLRYVYSGPLLEMMATVDQLMDLKAPPVRLFKAPPPVMLVGQANSFFSQDYPILLLLK